MTTIRRFSKSINNRKDLVKKIASITGIDSHYAGMPSMAYQIGNFTVEKDGTLAVTMTEDGREGAVILALKADGMIGEEIITSEEVQAEEVQARQAEINKSTVGNQATTSETTKTAEIAENEEIAESVNAANETVSELPNLPTMETAEESAIMESIADEATEQPQAASEEAYEECQQIAEPPVSSPELTVSPEPASTSITDCGDGPCDNAFSFPLADHTTRSMLNLINLIYTRGSLLSKSTGGNFGVDKDLITILADDDEYESKEFLVDFIREHVEEGARLDGISFTDTHVIFTGFPQAITDNATTDNAVTDRGMTAERGERDESLEKLEVFKRLAARMNKMAKEQKRIVPKEITEPNEKYALRIWLIRLGMNGADCKLDRKILLQNLSGHTAFRTEADKEKWIARQNAKKGKMHVVYEGPTDTTITEPMATNAPNTLTATETATALMATESTITAKEAL